MDTISILWWFCLICALLLKLTLVADHQRLRFVFLANLRKNSNSSEWLRKRSKIFRLFWTGTEWATGSHSSSFGMHQFAEELVTALYAALPAYECVNGNATKMGVHEFQKRRARNCLAMLRFKNPLAYCWDIRLYEMINLGCRKRSLGQFSFRA